MAKVVYFVSPFDDLKRNEFESDKTIGEVLIELGIEKESLSVIINGECPPDCDLEYKLSELDTLEIRRIVNGEGSSSGKKDLAMVVQIAALVAVTILSGGATSPWLLTGILVASSLVSGALMQRAAQLAMGDNSGDGRTEADISTNSYSLNNITNEARPLSAVPLVMGSHRIAPDIIAQPKKDIIYNTPFPNVTSEIPPIVQNNYIPGIVSTNGPLAIDSSWIDMPANYIAPGFPYYAIKIAPYNWGVLPGTLTPSLSSYIISQIKSEYLAKGANPSVMNFFAYSIAGSVFAPLVIYETTGPYAGRYNLFFFLARAYERPGKLDYLSGAISNLYTGTVGLESGAAGSWREGHFFISVGALLVPVYFNAANSLLFDETGYIPLARVGSLSVYWYPSTFLGSDNAAAIMGKISTYLNTLNNGVFNSSNKANSFAIERQLVTFGVTSVIEEGIDVSSQVFNYGIGDLTISERKIGAYDAEIAGLQSEYSKIKKTVGPKQWKIPNIGFPSFSVFPTDVKVEERKKLSNYDQNTNATDVLDQNTYNFIYFDGKYGHDIINFYITGHIYSTNTSTGFGTNSTILEVQWRATPSEAWVLAGSFGVLSVQNNNTKKLSLKVNISNIGIPLNEKLQMRVRKITLDSSDNNNNKVCSLYIEKLCSYRSAFGYYGDFSINAPENLEGLYISSLISESSQTNKYSALVDSKCWVYDFDLETWSWSYNRNPAFWFLFYARGGFLNLDSNPAYAFPYSPTDGWQNHAGHTDNSERIFGVGLTDSKIDLERILEWAEFCEDQELYMDLVLKDDTSCAEVLERISNIGRGSVTYYSGKLSVVWEDPEQIPTCLFGMGNIKAGSFAVTYKVSDPVRKVTVNYVNRETWETEFVEALVPFSDPDNINFVEITLEGVTETEQAQREANILAARQYFQRRTYSWEVDIEGLIAKRGDLVYLSHDSTQYGFSGRIKKFIVEAGVVVGIETTSILDSEINFITVKEPNGDMSIYECHLENGNIYFDEYYPLEKASQFVDNVTDNLLSNYPNSIPEDFVFISGAKETPGKIVRISEISTTEDYGFKIVAIDEDPAMWAYEYDSIIPSESFDDAELSLSVTNVEYKDLGGGLLKINWENVNGEMITIINEDTMVPIEASGSVTFTGGEVILELLPDTKYNLIIRPFSIGTAYKSTDKKVKVWLR